MNDGRKLTGIALAAVGALAGWGLMQGAMARAQQPELKSAELKSTEAFIEAFVEKNAYYEMSIPDGEFYSERDSIVFSGCKATVHVVAVGADEPPYKREKVKIDVLFDLGELAPEAEARRADLNGKTMPGKREWVMLRTASGAESIELRSGGQPISMTAVFPMQGGANHAETEKLAAAFRRAIAACRAQR